MLHLLPATKWLLYSLVLAAGFLRFAQARASDFLFIAPMEDSHKDQWVDAHNYLRRGVNDPEAANIRLMTWDDELAELAESAVKTCNFQHTSTTGLATSAFPEAGENLYAGSNYRFSEMMTRGGITKYWYDEIEFYSHVTLTCDAGEACGHYTQVVWATTYKVGCAIGSCAKVENGHGEFLVGCSYGPAGNYFSYGVAIAPYIEGEPCSACVEGDLCIDQLCNNTARDIPFTTPTPEITTATTSADTTSPVTSAGTTSPVTSADTTSLMTSADTTSPVTSADTTSPVTSADTTSPVTSADTTSLMTSADTTSPVTSADTTLPLISAVSTVPQTSVEIAENLAIELGWTSSASSTTAKKHSYITALSVEYFLFLGLIFSYLRLY